MSAAAKVGMAEIEKLRKRLTRRGWSYHREGPALLVRWSGDPDDRRYLEQLAEDLWVYTLIDDGFIRFIPSR